MQTDTNPTDDLDLTENERAELDADAKDAAAPAQEPPPPNEEPAPEPPDDSREQVSAAARAAQESAERAEQAALRAAAAAQPPAQEAPQPPSEPDWSAMRRDLRARNEAGTLEDEAFEAELEKLSDQRSEWIAERKVSQLREDDAKKARDQAEQQAQAEWQHAVAEFEKDPVASEFLANGVRRQSFQAVIHDLSGRRAYTSYADLLKDALTETMDAFGLKQPAANTAKEAVDKAIKDRQTPPAPPSMNKAPSAPPLADGNSRFADLDALGIDELENRVARMSEDELNAYLADAPGGLKDHARAP